jgi:two-component system, chemotaxis family, sensor kinase CheA
MKLTLRFVLLIAALLLSVAATATAGWRALGRLEGALDGVVKVDVERLLAITHTRRLFRSMVVLERDYLLSTSRDDRASMGRKMATTAAELQGQIDKYEKLMPSGDARAIASIRAVRARWLDLDAGVLEAAREGRSDAIPLAGLHAKDPVSWEGVIADLVKANEKRLALEVEETHTTYATARRTLLGVSGLAALLAASLGYLIFNGIRRNLRELSELNANLEAIVKVRTEALSERERSLRLVLDSTGDGIVGVRSDCTLAANASAAAIHWFGQVTPGSCAARHLFPEDGTGQELFRLGLDQLMDGFLPPEVALDQMPRRTERRGLILDLAYKQVPGESDTVLLVLARDVTAQVHSELAEQEARERQALVGRLLLDKQGFATFVSDAEHLVQSLDGEEDPVVARRQLHTLKGNVAVYGLGSMARLCHEVEDRLAEFGGLPLAAEVEALTTHLRHRLEGIEHFMAGLGRNAYEVEGDEHSAVIQSLLDRREYQKILQMVEVWSWPRTAERLARVRAETEYLAKRLGKQIRVEIEHSQLRLPSDYLDRFWPTVTHVVRNAVDHGIESPSLRAEHGKPAEGRIRLRSSQTEDTFCLEVEDDGGGVDLERVRQVARARGLQVWDDGRDVELIFSDGVTTRGVVTDWSGRGLGLSATRSACEAEGGSVEVVNRTGLGTRFTFRFPRPVVDTEALSAQLQRRWMLLPASDGRGRSTPPVPVEYGAQLRK